MCNRPAKAEHMALCCALVLPAGKARALCSYRRGNLIFVSNIGACNHSEIHIGVNTQPEGVNEVYSSNKITLSTKLFACAHVSFSSDSRGRLSAGPWGS